MHAALSLRTLFLPLIVAALIVAASVVIPHQTKAAGTMSVTGYAWSSYLGWISFSGTGYGVLEDQFSGDFSGYAWSSNLGWISFGSSDGSHPAASVDFITGKVTGWARACAAFADKNACSGALDANSGGWDGWISLSGTATDGSAYGITQSSTCGWSGYAWGSDAIGAIGVSGTAADGSSYGVAGTDQPTCAGLPTATLSANPSTIDSGQSSTLSWSSARATSCTAVGGFSTGGATSGSASTGALSSTQNYRISCTGSAGTASSNIATVTVLVPTVSISASPDRVVTSGGGSGGNGSTTISWNATNVNTCTITKNGATWKTLTSSGSPRTLSGSAPDTVSGQTSYVMSCTNNASASADAVAATATQVVNVVTSFRNF